MAAEQLITQQLDLWTAAIKRRSAAGRGSARKTELYGIKKLRELILELAVRGLLVPQDTQDEPASELLKKIAVEKTKLVKEGKIKNDKPWPDVGKHDGFFTAPEGWEWVRVADIGYDFGQKKPDANFTYIDVSAIDNRLGLIDSPTTLSPEEAPSRARKLVKSGTVIYSTVRPYLLNIAIVQKDFDPEPIASTAFAVVHPFEGVVSGYVYRYLRSPSFVSYVEGVQTGIAYPAINDRQFFSGLIPLPPTAEQRRIVAKVDELMALCDQLEQQTYASLSAHGTLVTTLLNALTNAADHAQLTSSWQRVAEHFDALFTTGESIDQLKQTILQLAVMGKLVPQDPNDEPASELLNKIFAEKARLVKAGQIRKENPVLPVGEEEEPFDLPLGWQWARLTEVAAVIDPNPSHRMPTYVEVGIPFISTENFVGADRIDFSIGKKVAPSVLAEQVGKFEIKKGAFAISRIGTIGKTRFLPLDRNYCMSHALCVISPYLDVFSHDYLLFVVSAESSLSQAHEGVQSIGVPDLGVGVIRGLLLPIPPLELQHRIVTKVDELMALCDQLKAGLVEAQTTQLHLTGALVEQALAKA